MRRPQLNTTDSVIGVLAVITLVIFALVLVRAFHQEITAGVVTLFGAASYIRFTHIRF